ncbi:MAG: AAA family ATPase [Lachnospiraceae bacterium]|nr:AAA family ATPase [Lachnospiraceae bacterium]
MDKTGFIREVLHSWSEVNLFTRPRRFGKSLNLGMMCPLTKHTSMVITSRWFSISALFSATP